MCVCVRVRVCESVCVRVSVVVGEAWDWKAPAVARPPAWLRCPLNQPSHSKKGRLTPLPPICLTLFPLPLSLFFSHQIPRAHTNTLQNLVSTAARPLPAAPGQSHSLPAALCPLASLSLPLSLCVCLSALRPLPASALYPLPSHARPRAPSLLFFLPQSPLPPPHWVPPPAATAPIPVVAPALVPPQTLHRRRCLCALCSSASSHPHRTATSPSPFSHPTLTYTRLTGDHSKTAAQRHLCSFPKNPPEYVFAPRCLGCHVQIAPRPSPLPQLLRRRARLPWLSRRRSCPAAADALLHRVFAVAPRPRGGDLNPPALPAPAPANVFFSAPPSLQNQHHA